MDNLVVYGGNWPASVNKDAKYSIRYEEGKYVVGIVYFAQNREVWYPTTDAHNDLVEMINRIKTDVQGVPGGAFYINEYRHVIVPAGNPVSYYFAGYYPKDLVFSFEGVELSGRPVKLDGKPLVPGDTWEGPHQGIRYKLAAGGKDVSYEKYVRPRVMKEITLSDAVGSELAKRTASKIGSIIGFTGGRFYINEYCQMFTGMPYRYIGALENDDPWFPEPDVP